MSLSNLRRAFRTALLKDLVWVTPHSFRRTVATVVRNARGPALAQQQLSHAKLAIDGSALPAAADTRSRRTDNPGSVRGWENKESIKWTGFRGVPRSG